MQMRMYALRSLGDLDATKCGEFPSRALQIRPLICQCGICGHAGN